MANPWPKEDRRAPWQNPRVPVTLDLTLTVLTTRKKKIENTETIDRVRRACGEVWTQTLKCKNWLYFNNDISLNKWDAMALFATGGLTKRVKEAWGKLPIGGRPEAYDRNPFVTETMRGAGVQQRQQTIRRLYDAFATYFENYSQDRSHNPPGRKRYYNARWVQTTGSSIKKEGDTLRLGGGRSVPAIKLDWPHPRPKSVDIGWCGSQPEVYAVYDSEADDLPDGLLRERVPIGDKTAGVDPGDVYMAAVYDGEESFVIGGGKLRELKALRNQEVRRFQKKMGRKQKGSSRWRKLNEAKKDRLEDIRNRIGDVMHKLTTRLVEELWELGVSTVAIGDLTGIRENVDYGSDANRRLHQWAFRQVLEKVEYKADRYGLEVETVEEAYTSSLCPNCGSKVSRRKRHFECRNCGAEGHSDVMGAMNIRAKYLTRDTQDPDEWKSGHLEAVRATATDDGSCPSSRGSASGRKTSSETEDAAAPTRATLRALSPRAIKYNPHMDCVKAVQ